MTDLITQINFLRFNLTQLEKLFVWAIIVISLDGFPLIPLNFENRPFSTILLVIYWLLEKKKSKHLSVFELRFWLLLPLLCLFTLYQAAFVHHAYYGFFKFCIAGTLSVITIAACWVFTTGLLKRFQVEIVIQIITYSLLLSAIIPVVLGFIQVLGLKEIIPRDYAESLTLIFSWRPLLDRPQLTTTEPSHAGTYLLLVIFWVFAFYHQKKKHRFLFLSILFLMFLFVSSSVAFIAFLLTIVSFSLLFFSIKRKKLIKYILLLWPIFWIVRWLSLYFIVDYTAEKFVLLSNLITNFDRQVFVFALINDYSFMDRFATPYLGLLSLPDTYWLGTGGESFFYLYPQLIEKHLPEMFYNQRLLESMDAHLHFVVKFLPAKLAAEFGLIGLFAFVFYFGREMYLLILLYQQTNNRLFRGLGLCSLFTLFSTYLSSYFNFGVILVWIVAYLLRKQLAP